MFDQGRLEVALVTVYQDDKAITAEIKIEGRDILGCVGPNGKRLSLSDLERAEAEHRTMAEVAAETQMATGIKEFIVQDLGGVFAKTVASYGATATPPTVALLLEMTNAVLTAVSCCQHCSQLGRECKAWCKACNTAAAVCNACQLAGYDQWMPELRRCSFCQAGGLVCRRLHPVLVSSDLLGVQRVCLSDATKKRQLKSSGGPGSLRGSFCLAHLWKSFAAGPKNYTIFDAKGNAVSQSVVDTFFASHHPAAAELGRFVTSRGLSQRDRTDTEPGMQRVCTQVCDVIERNAEYIVQLQVPSPLRAYKAVGHDLVRQVVAVVHDKTGNVILSDAESRVVAIARLADPRPVTVILGKSRTAGGPLPVGHPAQKPTETAIGRPGGVAVMAASSALLVSDVGTSLLRICCARCCRPSQRRSRPPPPACRTRLPAGRQLPGVGTPQENRGQGSSGAESRRPCTTGGERPFGPALRSE